MRTTVLLAALALTGVAYWFTQLHPEQIPPRLYGWVPGLGRIVANRLETPSKVPPSSRRPPAAPKKPTARKSAPKKPASKTLAAASGAAETPAVSANAVTLYLTNGGVVTGELVKETPAEIILRWEYGDVGFSRVEIKRMVRGRAIEGEQDIAMPWEGGGTVWTHQYDVVVKLMRGTVVDAEIVRVTPETVELTQRLPGGGMVEHTVKRADIDQLLFRPVHNARSKQIAENLQTIFPKMHWHEEGLFTIVTDSTPPTVKDYRRIIRELTLDWYLTFYPLLKGRSTTVQQHIVIFENWDSYIEYALTDGVPGWFAVGYFSPEDEVLYCFNMLGEDFSELLYDAYLGQFRKARDEVAARIKTSEYRQYQETIEGRLSTFLQKLESAHSATRQVYYQQSADTLRHELTHALFGNWRVQNVVLSQMTDSGKAEAEQKRKFLQETNIDKKRELLEQLLHGEETQTTVTRADNAWFVEGLAGYMEPAPVGGLNQDRLADIQRARRANQVMPLEFMNAFRLGSFMRMSSQSALYAYAQSWAFCHFMMHRYPAALLGYLDRLNRVPPAAGTDTLAWLIEGTGKEQRVLEAEFLAYVDAFPAEDPPWLKQQQMLIDLRSELTTLWQQLWGT